MTYLGLIHKDKNSGYGVSFPDFPGCVTVGDSLDEAQRMAHEALALHIEGVQEDGDPIPAPSPLDKVLKSDLARGHKAVIAVDVAVKPKPVRVNVIMDNHLLHQIDALTSNRSAWLADAARQKLSSKHPTS
jgi:predicted RNase H-like HicB family nuclease